MSKKLVKTAKQQFEERLRELGNHVAVEENGETFHSGIDKERHFHILRIGDADIEYSEFDYGCTLLELYENEEFLDKLAAEFAIGRSGIKPILEWWSDADKNREPFGFNDIIKFAPVKKFVEFVDLYEEVPDVRIITAKEQWEKDSQGAKATLVIENVSYRIVLLETGFDVYIHEGENEYGKESFPPLEELREDAEFVANYVSYISKNRSNFMNDALKWLRGGEYVMNEWGLMDIYSVCMGYCNTSYRYEDKEESAKVVKQDFSQAVDELRKKMVVHLQELCEKGMKVNLDYFTEEVGSESIVFKNDVSIPFCGIEDMWTGKDQEDKWALFMKIRGEEMVELTELSIETLLRIIASMQ